MFFGPHASLVVRSQDLRWNFHLMKVQGLRRWGSDFFFILSQVRLRGSPLYSGTTTSHWLLKKNIGYASAYMSWYLKSSSNSHRECSKRTGYKLDLIAFGFKRQKYKVPVGSLNPAPTARGLELSSLQHV